MWGAGSWLPSCASAGWGPVLLAASVLGAVPTGWSCPPSPGELCGFGTASAPRYPPLLKLCCSFHYLRRKNTAGLAAIPRQIDAVRRKVKLPISAFSLKKDEEEEEEEKIFFLSEEENLISDTFFTLSIPFDAPRSPSDAGRGVLLTTALQRRGCSGQPAPQMGTPWSPQVLVAPGAAVAELASPLLGGPQQPRGGDGAETPPTTPRPRSSSGFPGRS